MRFPKAAFLFLVFSFQIVFAQEGNQPKKKTILSGKPGKVSGILVFNYSLNNPAKIQKLEDKTSRNEIENSQPELKRKPKEIRVGVVNKRARYIPKPIVSRVIKASGEVKVEIAVDVNGKVVSAKAISGHPLLRPAAEASARRTRFAPTLINGPAIIVIAYLVYNFKSNREIEY
ncbi:MAG TPA: energy transducer TonB [Pyrinomonadaceae bacterium]|jgi:outer membrane biosynthesis protein TonB